MGRFGMLPPICPSPGPEWVQNQWELARRDAASGPVLLILDEVQKVRGWSEGVKACWDEDRAAGRSVHVLLLGSSAMLLARGVTESLAGRFFLHRCLHFPQPRPEASTRGPRSSVERIAAA